MLNLPNLSQHVGLVMNWEGFNTPAALKALTVNEVIHFNPTFPKIKNKLEESVWWARQGDCFGIMFQPLSSLSHLTSTHTGGWNSAG